MITEPIIFVLGLASTFIVMPSVIKKMKEKHIGGVDVHKKDRPFIPEMGGIAVLVGVTLSSLAATLLAPEKTSMLASFLGSVLIAGTVGAIDDLKTLNAKVKPVLTLLASAPILLLHSYYIYGPAFPLIGQTRMTMVYPLLIPIAIAVTSNAVNMMDPFNGTMSGTCTITTLFLLLSAILLGRGDGLLLCLCLIGPLLALYYFNRFPAKVFSGDVGSLSIGAALGAIAIIGRLEVVAIVAFAPQIMNAFYGLATIGRLYEGRKVNRPVTVLDDGRLMATKDPKAPITLARMILARGPLHEYEATLVFLALSAISGVLAVITAYLIVVAS